MFRKIDNHKLTATVTANGYVRIMCDVGDEDILDCHFNRASEAAGIAELIGMGFEEFDPNAGLKAMGMVFINGTYQMPK